MPHISFEKFSDPLSGLKLQNDISFDTNIDSSLKKFDRNDFI